MRRVSLEASHVAAAAAEGRPLPPPLAELELRALLQQLRPLGLPASGLGPGGPSNQHQGQGQGRGHRPSTAPPARPLGAGLPLAWAYGGHGGAEAWVAMAGGGEQPALTLGHDPAWLAATQARARRARHTSASMPGTVHLGSPTRSPWRGPARGGSPLRPGPAAAAGALLDGHTGPAAPAPDGHDVQDGEGEEGDDGEGAALDGEGEGEAFVISA
jgi:hypothetical protein